MSVPCRWSRRLTGSRRSASCLASDRGRDVGRSIQLRVRVIWVRARRRDGGSAASNSRFEWRVLTRGSGRGNRCYTGGGERRLRCRHPADGSDDPASFRSASWSAVSGLPSFWNITARPSLVFETLILILYGLILLGEGVFIRGQFGDALGNQPMVAEVCRRWTVGTCRKKSFSLFLSLLAVCLTIETVELRKTGG
jgi:hypothetical protein